jgi:tetratricopeptide (TPR) repeat protein
MTVYLRGVELFESGDYAGALRHFVSLAREVHDPREKAGVLLDQANCYWQLGLEDQAEHCLATAHELVGADPIGSLTTRLGQACLLIEQGRFQNALIVIDRVLADSRDLLEHSEFHCLRREVTLQRSVVLIHLARYCDAVPDLEAVLAEQPDGETYAYLARCYYEVKRHADAQRCFDLAIQHGLAEESHATLHYFWGRNYWELGEFVKARQHLRLSAQTGLSIGALPEAHDRLPAGKHAPHFAALGGD